MLGLLLGLTSHELHDFYYGTFTLGIGFYMAVLEEADDLRYAVNLAFMRL